MEAVKQPETFLQYPTPDSIQMVEEILREHSGEFKKSGIWNLLRGKMLYRTFCTAFSYFEETLRIARDRHGTVAWIWNPKMTAYYEARPDLAWK